MGHQSRARRANPIIHRKKLFDGRATAEEIHRQHAFPRNARCKCGSPKLAISAATFIPAWVAMAEYQLLASLVARNGGFPRPVDFRGPDGLPRKYLRLGTVYACDSCKKDLQVALARGPQDPALRKYADDIVIWWDMGPGPDKTIVQVPA